MDQGDKQSRATRTGHQHNGELVPPARGPNEAHDEPSRAQLANDAEHSLTLKQAIRLYPKATLWSFCLSLMVIMDGFDLVLMGNFIGFPAFQRYFGVPSHTNPDRHEIPAPWQAGLLNGSRVGQIVGYLICGVVAERYGYKKTMFATLLYLSGIIFIFFFALNLKMLVAATVLAGIPFGIFTVLSTAYASEVAPLALRPYLTSWVNCCWGIGQLLAVGTLRGFLTRDDVWGWRIPFGLQWMWIPPLLIIAVFCPESPWWLVRRGRSQDARRSLERLTTISNITNYNLDNMVVMMEETHNIEVSERAGASYAECFRGSNLRRTEIVCMAWACQVASGIVFFSVLSYFLQQAGLDSDVSFNFSMGNYAINILGTGTAWLLTACGFGRRRIFISGLASMVCVLITTGGVSIVGNKASSWATAALLLFWTVIYQCTVGTLTYAISGEIPSRKLLLKTINLGRSTYSIGFIIANSLNPYMISSDAWDWKGKAGFFWAGTGFLAFLWAYFRLPEARGLTFLEIDKMFDSKISARDSVKYAVDTAKRQHCTGQSSDKAGFYHEESIEPFSKA